MDRKFCIDNCRAAKANTDTNLIVAAIVIVVAWIQCGARFGIDFARIQSEKPNLWVFIDFLTLILGEPSAMQT